MDYLRLAKIFRYENYENFIKKNRKSRIVLMTTKATKLYHKFKFTRNDIILFGRESSGVPENLHKSIKNRIRIPIKKNARSLNIAIAVAIVVSESLRQNNF